LKTCDPKTPRFYMLPKVHKPNNPGRPVVGSVACYSSLISKYVDFHLNPVVQRLDSYVRDTTDFINKLSAINDLPKNTTLISMDVRSLYTNTPTNEGLEAVKSKLNEPINNKALKASPIVILELLKLILTCKILNLMASISCKSRVVQWEQYAPHLMLTSSWEHSKKTTFTHL